MGLLGLAFLYIVLRTFKIRHYILLGLILIGSGIIQAFYGYFQFFNVLGYVTNHRAFKITGSFFNPGPYSGFLASIYPIALGFFLFRTRIYNKFFEHDYKMRTNINHRVL